VIERGRRTAPNEPNKEIAGFIEVVDLAGMPGTHHVACRVKVTEIGASLSAQWRPSENYPKLKNKQKRHYGKAKWPDDI
jgi:hypothetical protein